MPFKKQPNGKYKSPSGRTFTKKQVQAYYATDGFKRQPNSKSNKGSRATAKRKKK